MHRTPVHIHRLTSCYLPWGNAAEALRGVTYVQHLKSAEYVDPILSQSSIKGALPIGYLQHLKTEAQPACETL